MKVPYIPRHMLKFGIKPSVAETERIFNGKSGLHLAGFDVETIGTSLFRHNDLYSVQIAMDTPECSHIFFPKAQGAQNLSYFTQLMGKGRRIFATAHNAGFDIGALLGKDVFSLMKGEEVHGWKGKVVDGTSSFLILRNKELKKSVTVADSMSWFKMSLQRFASAYLGKDMQKLQRPDFLGKRAPLDEKELALFAAYAEQDALIQLEATKLIYRFCADGEVRVSLTPAQLAGRVFQKSYLQNRIFLPDWKLLPFIARCYHGAQFTSFGRGTFKGVYYYDINSLYPFATMNVPLNFSNSKLQPLTLEMVERGYCGFLGVSFRFDEKEQYPCLPVQGMVRNFPKLVFPLRGVSFCTTEELLPALGRGCEVLGLRGIGWYPEQQDIDHPLGFFMRDIYARKEALDRMQKKEQLSDELRNKRQYYKLLLNSLIGKFCQRNRTWLSKEEVAGGLFKPDFGALILSKSRAIINQMISRHGAIYSDTDCLLTRHSLPCGSEIGQLKNELGDGVKGDLLAIRSKLYFVTARGSLVKCARHGFRQPSEEVFKQLLQKRKQSYVHYSINRLTRLREAYKRNRLPRREVSQTFRIMLADDGKRIYEQKLSTVGDLLDGNTLSRPLARVEGCY